MKINIKSIQIKIVTLFTTLFFIFNLDLNPVKAEYTNLIPCKESTNFQKRLTNSIKKLENRLKYYEVNSQESNNILKEIESTKARFEQYSKSNLLCGKEGLPRIIASGQWDHSNEFTIPGILFLYIAGWIGWVGRKYLRYSNTTENSFENEIIINVPVALSLMTSGFLWPIDAWKEFINKDLLASDKDITISPR